MNCATAVLWKRGYAWIAAICTGVGATISSGEQVFFWLGWFMSTYLVFWIWRLSYARDSSREALLAYSLDLVLTITGSTCIGFTIGKALREMGLV